MEISRVINLFHSGLSIYLSTGWLLSPIHNKILLGFIPCVYFNWILDDKQCLLTKLEYYFTNTKSNKIHYEGFISKKLKSMNIQLEETMIDQIISIILFHSFFQSYKNIIIYNQ